MSQVPASQAELNKFVKVVDEFKAKRQRLLSPQMRADVYNSGNARLIEDYETTVTRVNALERTINTLVGAWSTFKAGYRKVTDTTSTIIGDAIDEIRSWFGYDPAPGIGCYTPMGALGAIQIPAAVAVAGIISAAAVLIAAMNRIFVSVEATRIQRENPGISREAALDRASGALPSLVPGGISLTMLAAGAAALYFILSERK